tara:strand:- start:196 stop:432 length:237 start_codon:yes stop_codon:yes gene_type:complete
MKSKNIPVHIKTKSIKEAQNEINDIINKLENKEINLNDYKDEFNRMIMLNHHIQEVFKKKNSDLRKSKTSKKKRKSKK